MANTIKVNKDTNVVDKIEAVNFEELPNMADYANVTPHVEKSKTWIYVTVCSLIGILVGVSLYLIMIYAN